MAIWETNSKFIWYYAIAYGLKEGIIKFEEDLRPFRRQMGKNKVDKRRDGVGAPSLLSIRSGIEEKVGR